MRDMIDCKICGGYGQPLTIFGIHEFVTLCRAHRNRFDEEAKTDENARSLLQKLNRTNIELLALEILYSGLGPKHLRELSDKLFAGREELAAIKEELRDAAEKILDAMHEEFEVNSKKAE